MAEAMLEAPNKARAAVETATRLKLCINTPPIKNEISKTRHHRL
jgi:hypothetical protein